ncbi:MAG: M15 family metallopeptidase [Oligoflexia bacterium]|nr:M15 family metallopeptidase [Oligoflexia bacterium]
MGLSATTQYFKTLLVTLLVTLTVGSTGSHADVCHGFSSGPKHGDDILTLINKEAENKLTRNYLPSDLVRVPPDYLAPGRGAQFLRAEALTWLERLIKEGAQNGFKFYVVSGFRSFEDQCMTFRSKITKWSSRFGSFQKGLDYAKKSSAEPGRSQHQLGTTVDLTIERINFKFLFSITSTPEFLWISQNAHRFGYVMSYPWADDDQDGLGYNSKTGYYFEPWHWRYVGQVAATEIFLNKMLLDDFIKNQNQK